MLCRSVFNDNLFILKSISAYSHAGGDIASHPGAMFQTETDRLLPNPTARQLAVSILTLIEINMSNLKLLMNTLLVQEGNINSRFPQKGNTFLLCQRSPTTPKVHREGLFCL